MGTNHEGYYMTKVKGTVTCPCGEVVLSETRIVPNVTGLVIKEGGFYFLGHRLPEKLSCLKCGNAVVDGQSMNGSTSVETEG